MKKILIIDDQVLDGRQGIYESTLSSEFELTFVFNGGEVFTKIKDFSADLYLVDIVLDSWSNNGRPLEITDVLDSIKSKDVEKPILLVSSQYDVLVENNKLTRLMNTILSKEYNVLNFIVWNEFVFSNDGINDANNALSRIELELAKYQQVKSNDADIGIVTALKSELEPFLNKFEEKNIFTEKINNTAIRILRLKTKTGKVIRINACTQENMGMVDCAYMVSMLKERFSINHLFMIGVCGGRDGEVNIGDVIIPDTSIAYQFGKLEEGKGLVLDASRAERESQIKQVIDEKTINDFLKEIMIEYNNHRMQTDQGALNLENPNVKFEAMACGDMVIDVPGELDKLAEKLGSRKLCSVDMESYSIYRATKSYPNLEVSVIKSVMDLTSKKNDAYKVYASLLSAELLFHLLYEEIYRIN